MSVEKPDYHRIGQALGLPVGSFWSLPTENLAMNLEFEPISPTVLDVKEYEFHFGPYRHTVRTSIKGTEHQTFLGEARLGGTSSSRQQSEADVLADVISFARIYGYQPKESS
jgi:hypothetical protein